MSLDLESYILGKKSGGGGEEPTGTIDITTNGITNVKSYASANVNVQPDLESKTVTITENTTTVIEPTTGKDGLSSVSVITNIPSGSSLDWSALGYTEEPASIEDDYNYALQIKNNWNNPIDLNYYFQNNNDLVYMPLVNINSSATKARCMFQNCTCLKKVPLLDFSHITVASSLFASCTSLEEIEQFDFSNVTTGNNMFQNCVNLKEIPSLNLGKMENFGSLFYNCEELTTLGLIDCSSCNVIGNYTFYSCKSLTNLGGFKDLGKAYLTSASANYADYTLDLSTSNNITHDSLMNVINNLYDIATAGVQTQQLIIGSTNLAKLSAEEIAIATNKGWTVS